MRCVPRGFPFPPKEMPTRGGHSRFIPKGSGGSGLSVSADVLDPIGERDTADHLRQVVMTIEPSPALLGGLGQLENQGERGLVRQAALGAHRAMADRRERALDWVRGP